jgi:predicted acylesterase/phospholipase RssA
MAKRLAITIAGAVSLGSYEAGVLYELMRAIGIYNDEAPADKKIYVDVITGASAGGMTAAMVSQRLMYDAASLEGEFTNALYQAWVERISLMELVKMGWREKKWHSLFSSDLIDRIGSQMLVTSMEQKGSGPHAAVEQINGVPQTLRVGLALTNLNGIDYMIPIAGNDDDGFNYTTSVDQMTFEVTADGQHNESQWKRMCSAAVGSGAFPAAFRPKAISRSVEEYGDALPANSSSWVEGKTYVKWQGTSPEKMAYSDGGVLQNQPLGIAKNLVDAAVQDRAGRLGPSTYCDGNDRLYVFVAPHSVKSSAQDLLAQKITILDELKQLVNVYMRQAMFHDWIVAEGVNQQIRSLDGSASGLAQVIAKGSLDVASLLKASSDLNAVLMPSKNEEQDRLTRLQEQYSVEYKNVSTTAGPQAAEAFVSALATLEAAAHLESRDKMKIVAVIADPKTELAGSGLAAFVGFFKKSFREHDYWVGRTKTREYLQRTDVKHILGVTEWPEKASLKTDLPNPSGVTLPLSNFEIVRAAVVPAIIMVLIRPVLFFIVVVALCLLGLNAWYLLR